MATITIPRYAFSLPMEPSITRRFYKLRVSDSPSRQKATRHSAESSKHTARLVFENMAPNRRADHRGFIELAVRPPQVTRRLDLGAARIIESSVDTSTNHPVRSVWCGEHNFRDWRGADRA